MLCTHTTAKSHIQHQLVSPVHDARHPRPRSIQSHLHRHGRPVVSMGGLSAASHLGWWVRKRLVGYTCCMSLCRCRPVLVGQTVSNGANSGVGPPTGVMWQLRWARVWGCEGGGAPHTHPLVPAQVWVSWHRGKMKWWFRSEGSEGGDPPCGRRTARSPSSPPSPVLAVTLVRARGEGGCRRERGGGTR